MKKQRSASQSMLPETRPRTAGGHAGAASAQERLRGRLLGKANEYTPESTLRPEPLFREKSPFEQSSTDDIAGLLRKWIDLDAKEFDLLAA